MEPLLSPEVVKFLKNLSLYRQILQYLVLLLMFQILLLLVQFLNRKASPFTLFLMTSFLITTTPTTLLLQIILDLQARLKQMSVLKSFQTFMLQTKMTFSSLVMKKLNRMKAVLLQLLIFYLPYAPIGSKKKVQKQYKINIM